MNKRMVPDGLSMTYLVRIMGVLISHGEVTTTNLAMLSRVNHKRCRELIRCLQDSGYVATRMHRSKRYVILTEAGYNYGKHLLEVSAVTRIMDAYKDNANLEVDEVRPRERT
ncbi:MAG: hypothetical protein ACREBU_01200 [Nitrososphaera sp.]